MLEQPRERELSGIFAQIKPVDGYHVVQVDLAGGVGLYAQVYANGALCTLDTAMEAVTTICELLEATPEQRGACTRLNLVLDAIARYFTTGGTWQEFETALQTLRRVISAEITFPGYYYHEGYVTTKAMYQHVFVKEGTDEAVLWMEPRYNHDGSPYAGWFYATTLDELEQMEINDDEGEEREGEQGEGTTSSETTVSRFPQLRHYENPPTA